jgi:catechol 2,3-dioxygenase-like lactoylglutathione lyase family enzyme
MRSFQVNDTSPSQPPFGLVGIDHVVLLVTDMARALKFYEEVLGARVGFLSAHCHGTTLVRHVADRSDRYQQAGGGQRPT